MLEMLLYKVTYLHQKKKEIGFRQTENTCFFLFMILLVYFRLLVSICNLHGEVSLLSHEIICEIANYVSTRLVVNDK